MCYKGSLGFLGFGLVFFPHLYAIFLLPSPVLRSPRIPPPYPSLLKGSLPEGTLELCNLY